MKHLEEKKNDLITRAEELLNQAKAEERNLTEEEAKELETIRNDIRAIKKTLGLEDDIKAEKDLEEKKDTQEGENMTTEEKAKENAQTEERAFENFVRGYVVHERAGELPKTGNTAVIPTTIANKIIKKVYDISPILERADRYNVKGNLDLPYYDTDTSTITVAYQTEFTAMTSSAGSFKSISLTGFLAGALTKISRSLINNAQFDIVNFIVDEMAYAIKRFIEKELLVGTTDKVTGLSTLTNTLTTAAATAVTADEIIKLHDKVTNQALETSQSLLTQRKIKLTLQKRSEKRTDAAKTQQMSRCVAKSGERISPLGVYQCISRISASKNNHVKHFRKCPK